MVDVAMLAVATEEVVSAEALRTEAAECGELYARVCGNGGGNNGNDDDGGDTDCCCWAGWRHSTADNDDDGEDDGSDTTTDRRAVLAIAMETFSADKKPNKQTTLKSIFHSNECEFFICSLDNRINQFIRSFPNFDYCMNEIVVPNTIANWTDKTPGG